MKLSQETKATMGVGVLVAVISVFVLGASPIVVFIAAAAAFVYMTMPAIDKDKGKGGDTAVDVLAAGAAAAIKDEVFHVGDNKFDYNEADAVCRAYGSQLATYNQVEDSYKKGGEWCSYGWSQGGMALFPTQQSTWASKYKNDEKHSCGRPGVNGGYFDPKMKFGVNCYGVKPAANQAEMDALFNAQQGMSAESRKEKALIDRLKGELQSLKLAPWNSKEWSAWSAPASASNPTFMKKLNSMLPT